MHKPLLNEWNYFLPFSSVLPLGHHPLRIKNFLNLKGLSTWKTLGLWKKPIIVIFRGRGVTSTKRGSPAYPQRDYQREFLLFWCVLLYFTEDLLLYHSHWKGTITQRSGVSTLIFPEASPSFLLSVPVHFLVSIQISVGTWPLFTVTHFGPPSPAVCYHLSPLCSSLFSIYTFYRSLGRCYPRFSSTWLLAVGRAMTWPGNIRQLSVSSQPSNRPVPQQCQLGKILTKWLQEKCLEEIKW